jgi:hypothetical protein
MSNNDKTAIRRRRFSAATMLVAAGAVAASTFGSTAVANAFPPGWGASKNYEDCVAKAESVSIPAHDANAVNESCCASFFGVIVTNPNTGEVVGCVVPPGLVRGKNQRPHLELRQYCSLEQTHERVLSSHTALAEPLCTGCATPSPPSSAGVSFSCHL